MVVNLGDPGDILCRHDTRLSGMFVGGAHALYDVLTGIEMLQSAGDPLGKVDWLSVNAKDGNKSPTLKIRRTRDVSNIAHSSFASVSVVAS